MPCGGRLHRPAPASVSSRLEPILRERKNGFLVLKRHRMKHLDFLSFLLESRRSVIQNHLPRPLSSSIIYAAFVDADSWTICGTFGTGSKIMVLMRAWGFRESVFRFGSRAFGALESSLLCAFASFAW